MKCYLKCSSSYTFATDLLKCVYHFLLLVIELKLNEILTNVLICLIVWCVLNRLVSAQEKSELAQLNSVRSAHAQLSLSSAQLSSAHAPLKPAPLRSRSAHAQLNPLSSAHAQLSSRSAQSAQLSSRSAQPAQLSSRSAQPAQLSSVSEFVNRQQYMWR